MKLNILLVGKKVVGKFPTIISLSWLPLFVAFLIIVLLLPNSLYSQESKKSPYEDVKKLLELGDTAWKKRGTRLDSDNAKAVEFYRTATEADPFSYEAHWKCARALWWQSDQLLDDNNTIANVKKEEQEQLGRKGMEIAKRAKLINPEGAEGHLYYALTAFHYAFGIGIINAMKGGVFDAIYEDLMWCYKNDKGFDKNHSGGMVSRGLSAYFRIVPWPKRDNEKSFDFATGAVRADDSSIRNMIFLAAAYEVKGMSEAAVGALEVAVEMEGDKEREPDFKSWKKFGKRCIKAGRVINSERLF